MIPSCCAIEFGGCSPFLSESFSRFDRVILRRQVFVPSQVPASSAPGVPSCPFSSLPDKNLMTNSVIFLSPMSTRVLQGK